MVSVPVQAPLDDAGVPCRGLTKDYGQGHGLFDQRDSRPIKRRVGYLPGELPAFPGVSAGYVVGLLFGAALPAVAAIVVALVRRPPAVTLMAVLDGASCLLAWLVPTLQWPQWLNKLSVFRAFGHPYLARPSTAQLLILLAVAVVGSAAAGAIADRTAKVP